MKESQVHKVWTVRVEIDETDDESEARATIEIDEKKVGGWGRARRSPDDPKVPRIGEELATARALGDLAHHMLDAAAVEIEEFTSQEARPHA